MAVTQAMVDDMTTAIQALATGKVAAYQLRDGRTVTYLDIDKLRRWRKALSAELLSIGSGGGRSFAELKRAS